MYSYFQDGSLSAMTLPGSGQVSNPLTSYNSGQFSYVYDPGGRLANLYVPWPVSSEGVGSKNKFNYIYENNNWLYYVSGDLGYCRYAFDGRGFVTSLSNISSSTRNNFSSNISTYGSLTYDAAGNRLTEQMQSLPTDTAFAWDHALTWTYDGRDRLTHEHSAGLSSATVPSAATINYDQYFGYDGADNLTNFKDPAAGQMADFGFNVDNQADNPMGFSFDGAGSMLAEPTGGLFAGDTLAYDPEERLVSATSGSTTLLANTYDGAGVREIKTTAADGTVYFLLDASGAPVVEETYTGTTASFGIISAFGPDGLRSRYFVPNNSETAFFYDPQGTLVNRIVSTDRAVSASGEPMTDVSVWDGYGQQRSDQGTGGTIDQQYVQVDPVGFEGQAGYYQDWELSQTSGPPTQPQYVYLRSVPSLLTHRYYDASTGRFVNRDPIGYGGGANLYAYCGGNPVDRTDPSGNASDKVPLGQGQYYVELDSFIPDKTVSLSLGRLNFGTYGGDGRINDPSNPSARSFEGFLIDTSAGTVTRVTHGTGDTHEISGLGSPWVGNSEKLGRTAWSSTASRDAAGGFTIHFKALSANPRLPKGVEPVINYDITLKFNASGGLASATGTHSAFPGFEIYEYGGGSPRQLYIWDPHNSFDLYLRCHWDYSPVRGLPTIVNLNGSVHGLNGGIE